MAANNNKKPTLCWDCANYAFGCSWSEDCVPVKGWEAVPCKGKHFDSYLVLDCPLFDRDARDGGMRRMNETKSQARQRSKTMGYSDPKSDTVTATQRAYIQHI